jgi:predicted transcriptional regulator
VISQSYGFEPNALAQFYPSTYKLTHLLFSKEYILTSLPYPSMLPALEIIPKRRRKLGLTQSQLAELAGVSQSYIAKLEAGNIEPSYLKVKALFEALDKLEQEKQVSAGQIMNRSVVVIQNNTIISDAIEIMRRNGFSQLPVMDGEYPVGSISEGTLLDHIIAVRKNESQAKVVSEIMDEPFPQVGEDAPVSLMTNLLKFYPAVLVQRKGGVVGIVTKADMLGIIN